MGFSWASSGQSEFHQEKARRLSTIQTWSRWISCWNSGPDIFLGGHFFLTWLQMPRSQSIVPYPKANCSPTFTAATRPSVPLRRHPFGCKPWASSVPYQKSLCSQMWWTIIPASAAAMARVSGSMPWVCWEGWSTWKFKRVSWALVLPWCLGLKAGHGKLDGGFRSFMTCLYDMFVYLYDMFVSQQRRMLLFGLVKLKWPTCFNPLIFWFLFRPLQLSALQFPIARKSPSASWNPWPGTSFCPMPSVSAPRSAVKAFPVATGKGLWPCYLRCRHGSWSQTSCASTCLSVGSDVLSLSTEGPRWRDISGFRIIQRHEIIKLKFKHGNRTSVISVIHILPIFHPFYPYFCRYFIPCSHGKWPLQGLHLLFRWALAPRPAAGDCRGVGRGGL